MKSPFRQCNRNTHKVTRFFCVLFAANCLITRLLDVECANTGERDQNRFRRSIHSTDIHWADENHIYIQASLGSNRQPFNLLLDTFDAGTWVASVLTTSPAWKSRNRFATHQSITFKRSKSGGYNSNQIQYPVGGVLASDSLQVGKLEFQDFPFLLVVGLPRFTLFPQNLDGVFGLSYGAHDDEYRKTFLDVTNTAYLWDHQSFGIKLCPTSGLLFIGDVCTECTTENLKYAPVKLGAKQWVIELSGITINQLIWKSDLGDAFFGASCGWIKGPENIIKELNDRLKFRLKINETYYFGRGKPNRFPKVGFSTNSRSFILNPEDYYRMDSLGNYYSVFRSTNDQRDGWILGLPIFRKHYIHFHKKTNMINFAPARC